MYYFISNVSHLFRAYLCYLTIDGLSIFENALLNNIFLEVFSLYTLLWFISRIEVGIFYSRGENPAKGSIMYFFVYLVNLGILYLIMLVLTKVGVLPIGL